MSNYPRRRDVLRSLTAGLLIKKSLLYWRKSLFDGVYSVPGTLIRPSGNSLARFVGYMPGLEVRWQIDRHAYLQTDYEIFYAGAFLQQTMPGRNLNYICFWAGYKF